MQIVDKQLVEQQFRRAADSYDRQAMIQHRVADHLLDKLEQHGENCGKNPQKVLEIGCCTGLLTRKLVDRFGTIRELVLNDLVEDFADRSLDTIHIPHTTFIAGDIETTPLPGSFDLIISSSTFHWVHDLEGLLEKLADHLTPNGCLAFSMYGPDNLQEIRRLTGIGLDYSSLDEVRKMVSRHLTLDHSDQQRQIFHYPAPLDILNHLRQTGVNGINRTPWTRSQLDHFCNQYREQFSSDQGVRLTYHPLYLLAHR